MLILQGITYTHSNRDILFSDIDLVINRHDKIALIGNNGSGKSTLLNILAGNLHPTAGNVKTGSIPYYVPQIFGQFDNYTIAEALQIGNKLNALKEILTGNVSEENLLLLNDDWSVEERCRQAFSCWKIDELELTQKIGTLSGGQKTKVFLAGINIHQPDIVLLDEPSNHLDTESRIILYDYIKNTENTLVIVSHDRVLLNLINIIYELNEHGIITYGGNYDFYTEQKMIESNAFTRDLKNKEKALRKAKETERESLERQQKLDSRGKKKQEKAGLPTISMNTFRNSAEKSTARIKATHSEKIDSVTQQLEQLRDALPGTDKMKIQLENSVLHRGKTLITAKNINFGYGNTLLWKEPLNFQVNSGERIVIKGPNGSGKTTLIKLMLGSLEPAEGTIERTGIKAIYIDQDYSLIDNQLSIYQQAQQYNNGALHEHEIKIRLTRFLFTKEHWDKPCKILSGGEKMRLMLCCLTIGHQAPDIIVLDEPTNNLDIQNIEILTAAINEYKGTLMVISHDESFLEQANVENCIQPGIQPD